MTKKRDVLLRTRAVLLFCVLGSGCGSKSVSLSDPNAAPGQQGASKSSASGVVGVQRDESPFRLTSASGADLRMTTLEVKGVAAGPLAFTELHFVFKNAEPRVIEGRFRVALPESASISRFAMKTSAGWQECFEIDAPRQRGDRRYSLFAHYFRRGPMGAGLGKLEIVEHDGNGKLTFESRPYVVTRDGARASLGDVSYERKIAEK